MKPIRWSENDRYLGPFTVSRNGPYQSAGIILGSGDGDEYAGCRLRVSFLGWTLIAPLPQIIRPWRVWVDTSRHDWSKPGGGHWDSGEREYGFTLSDGHLSVALGRVTNDSSTEQRWGCFLPWTQWRCTAHRYYDATGALSYAEPLELRDIEDHREHWRKQDEVSTADFLFRDFDGEELTAKTRVEEYEHRLGTGLFKWLSLFTRRKVRRSLYIRFSGETGRRKGSWKGGTIGHGIEMLPLETHEAAFRRYCAEHDMTFIRAALAQEAGE